MNRTDALEFLRDEHKVLTGLFRQMEAAPLRAGEMVDGIRQELQMRFEIHTALEERVFYAELRAAAEAARDTDALELVEEALRDHREALQGLGRLRGTSALSGTGEDWSGWIADVETHIAEEESRLFLAAERLLEERLAELGDQLRVFRQELEADVRFQGARPEQPQNPSGGEQSRTPGHKTGQAA